MNFEYILLLILYILPLWYKISFWQEIFSQKQSSFFGGLRIGFSHFWTFIEIPLFLLSMTIFFNPLFEIFLYNFFFYFFFLQTIFVLGKIFRKKFPKGGTKFLRFCIFGVFFLSIYALFFVSPLYGYISMIGVFFVLPVVVFFINNYLEGRFEK